ncbi:hypothetical protein EVG20_g4862 [Dentipellis fragilis]|uniref:Zn(2)-C6 fungal-type domain-containing protein n=1 Tax=Dentipellis fragilis TaxID=205917 RepID=A0A4Y9YUH8_9AGAM|nr:hypothetical protein EVG20_g4862 [Dentipellis fragilis]
MDPTSSKSPGSSTSLSRGKACTNCRRRKMRCDGARPVCGQCRRTGRPEECGYTDTQARSRTQVLEENIAALQARIMELENPEIAPTSSGPVLLHEPHSRAHRTGQQSSPVFGLPMSPVAFSPGVTHSSVASSSSTPSVGATNTPFKHREHAQLTMNMFSEPQNAPLTAVFDIADDTPPEVASQLLDHFFAHSAQLGWFMHVGRFRNALLQLPEDDSGRPISALINAVYLFGATIMRHTTGSDLPVDESVFLSRALCKIGTGLAGAPSHQIVQVIQARLLLALYHYTIGMYIEGRHQSDAAASLVMACGLHRIRSAEPFHNPLSFVDIIPLTLAEPRDQVEEGERINGMWTAFAIDRCWAVAFGAPVTISDSDTFGTQIDTPWPLDMEAYERGPVYPNFRSRSTLRNFVAGINTSWPWENHSLLAKLSTAAALFDRATYFASSWVPGATDMNAFYTHFVSLDQRIEDFKSQLFSLENLDGATSEITRTMHSIHLLAAAASIQLHSAFSQQNAGSRNKCFLSAKTVVHANEITKAHEFLMINPLLGIVWAAACQVLIRELVFMRSVPITMAPPLPEREMDARASLDKLLAIMAIFAPDNAFINYQLGRVQQELLGL